MYYAAGWLSWALRMKVLGALVYAGWQPQIPGPYASHTIHPFTATHCTQRERERERDIYIYTRTVCDASSHDVDDKVVQRSKAPNAHLLNVRAGPLEDWLGMR